MQKQQFNGAVTREVCMGSKSLRKVAFHISGEIGPGKKNRVGIIAM